VRSAHVRVPEIMSASGMASPVSLRHENGMVSSVLACELHMMHEAAKLDDSE
jgi:hypothetical protein